MILRSNASAIMVPMAPQPITPTRFESFILITLPKAFTSVFGCKPHVGALGDFPANTLPNDNFEARDLAGANNVSRTFSNCLGNFLIPSTDRQLLNLRVQRNVPLSLLAPDSRNQRDNQVATLLRNLINTRLLLRPR